jgi:hypothetical protein
MNFDFHLPFKPIVCKISVHNYFFYTANDCSESFPNLTLFKVVFVNERYSVTIRILNLRLILPFVSLFYFEEMSY